MSADAHDAVALVDLDAAWELDAQVALRQEGFGGLAYNYGTRRLSMIRSRALLELVRSLAGYPSARAALRAAGVAGEHEAAYEHALWNLAQAGVITRREAR